MPPDSKITPRGINAYLSMGGKIRCLAERKTFLFISPTFENQRVKNVSTLYIGSRTSERFVRIYDKRGFTRLELEAKKKMANLIFRDFISHDMTTWCYLAKSHLLDYIDFADHAEWKELTEGVIRPAKVKNIISQSLTSTEKWVNDSVAPTLAMLVKIYGAHVLRQIARGGKDRINDRQVMMIKNAGLRVQEVV
jgi:hypothetical protein